MEVSRRDLLAGAVCLATSGCTTLPSRESVELAARGIGGSVGLVLNDCNLPTTARTLLSTVVSAVVSLTPQSGETLIALWTVAARAHVAALVAAGTVTALNGAIVLAAFVVVLAGLSLLERRYPVLTSVKELAAAAVTGFGDGFLATFRPTGLAVQTYDAEVYDTLKADPATVSLQVLTEAVSQTEDAHPCKAR